MAGRNRAARVALLKTTGFAIWTAVVSLFLLWEATSYSGVMSLIGEWQFNAIGRHYPTFNYVVLVFVLLLPGYLLFMRPRRVEAADRSDQAMLRSALVFLRAATATAITLAVGMLVMLIALLLLPRDSGPRQLIDLARPVPSALAEGPTTLTGQVLYERTAGFDQDMLIARKQFRFTPVVAPGFNGDNLKFFVQLPPEDGSIAGAAAPVSTPLSGVLKRNGLPGEVLRLFRYAGFEIDDPPYVLFVEPGAMRWPYLALLVQFLIGAFLAAIVGNVQWRRYRRIDKAVTKGVDPAVT